MLCRSISLHSLWVSHRSVTLSRLTLQHCCHTRQRCHTGNLSVFVEGMTDKRLLLSLLRYHEMNTKSFNDPLRCIREEPDYKAEAERKIPLTIKSCSGNMGVAQAIYKSLIYGHPYLAVVDGDSVLPPLCKKKLLKHGVTQYSSKPRRNIGKLAQLDSEWLDLPLESLILQDPTVEVLPKEPFSYLLFTDLVPTDFLLRRLQCATFADVIRFYEDSFDMFVWKRHEMTLEDAFIQYPRETKRKAMKNLLMSGGDSRVDDLLKHAASDPSVRRLVCELLNFIEKKSLHKISETKCI